MVMVLSLFTFVYSIINFKVMEAIKSKPVIYLNKDTIDDKEYLKLFFKANNTILERIKSNDWIRYSIRLKAYYIIYNSKNMALTEELFSDIAIVNKTYLHAKVKVHADEIVLNKALVFNEILPAAKKSGSILLVPVADKDTQMLLIKYKYNKEIYQLLKRDKNVYWNNPYRCFFLPGKLNALRMFIKKHIVSLNIKIHHSMVINDFEIKKMLMEQHYQKNQSFKSCPDSYLKSLVLNNRSWNTIKTYHYYLLRFINTYKTSSIERINEFSSNAINDYHYYLKQEKRYSVKSINQSVSAIKYYYREVLKRKMDFESISRGKRGREVPRFYSIEDIKKILDSIVNIKHKAMLTLIYSSGLRVSELLELKPKEILSDRKQIFIKGSKGDVDRYTILSDKALEILRDYWKEYHPQHYLFEGQFGGKYSASSVRNVLKKAIKKANVNSKGATHSLRHSFATHLIESGVDIRYVQALLGHKSLKTTEIYTHVTNTYLQSIKSPLDSMI